MRDQLQNSDHLYNRTRRRKNADAGDESRSNGLLAKPFDDEVLLKSVRAAMEN